MIRAQLPPKHDPGVRLGRRTRIGVLGAWALLLVAVVVACVPVDDGRGPAPVSATEVADFGRVTLPAGAEVLGTSTDGAIDTRYRMTLRVTAAQLRELLAQSDFTTPVIASERGRDLEVLAGPAPASATDLRYAQDRIDTEHGTVTREIVEDHRSPDEIYVHLSMFTT